MHGLTLKTTRAKTAYNFHYAARRADNLRSKLRIMQIIRVEAARQHGWNANFGERTPGAHGDDRRPFGCRRRPLGRRAHLTGPGNLNLGGVARQRDGGYRVRPRSGPGTKEWTRMTVGAECVIPRTLSGAVMLQKCNISVTRLLQKPGIIVSIRPHTKRQFPSNSNNCVYLLIYAVMNVDNVVKLA